MNPTIQNPSLPTLAHAGLALLALTGLSQAQVTFNGSASWTQATATTANTYNASSADKLVVVVTGEHNFPNDLSGNVTGITYNGQTLIKAVEVNPTVSIAAGGHGQTTSDIWYLDNPDSYAGPGTITVSFNGNNWVATAIGLSGTAPGVGATATATKTASVDLTTTRANSMVIASFGMGGSGNTASATVNANAPLTKFAGLVVGNNWASHNVGRATAAAPGTQSLSFSSALTDVVTIAAEFPPISGPFWDVNSTAEGAGGPVATGIWSGSATNWSPQGDGTATTTGWSAGQAAVFAAGADATEPYTVTVNGAQDVSGLTFQDGSATLANGTAGSLRLTGPTPVKVNSGLTATLATPIGEDASPRELSKLGAGTLEISGDLSHTGATTVTAGTLILSGNNAAATGGLILNGGVTRFASPASINGTTDNVTVNAGGVLAFHPTFLAANIPAALLNRIDAASTGTIAADDYAGTNFDFNAAGLTAARLGAIGSVVYTGTLTPNGTTYRLGGGGGTLTLANPNALTGELNSAIIQGNVVLAGANNHGAGTTLSAGANLTLGNAASLGTGTFTIAGNGIVQAAETVVTSNAIAGNADFTVAGTGTLTLGGTITLGANRIITNNNTTATTTFGSITGTNRALTISGAGNTTISGDITTGTGALTKNGSGWLTLRGANTYSGTTTISGGRLILEGSNSSAGATTLTLNQLHLASASNGGLASGNLTFGNATQFNAIIVPVGADRVISNNLILNNTHGQISGEHSLQINGTFTNSGGNRTLTNTLVAGKTLTLAGQVNLSNDTTSRTLTITGTAANPGDTLISGPIVNGSTSAAGALVKSGPGTLTLTNTNTYAGATTINNDGKLVVKSPGSIAAASAVAVNGTSTLGGDGTIFGSVTVAAGGNLAPGAPVGTLAIGGDLNLFAMSGGAGRLSYELGALAGTNDRINVTGSLDIGDGTLGAANFSFADLGGLQQGTYTLITSGGIIGSLDTGDLRGKAGNFVGTLQLANDNKDLVLVVALDTTAPTLVSIADNRAGAPIDANTPVTYTVTFNEVVDSASVTAEDFGNAGTSAFTVGTITQSSPGVFAVQVTPTTAGTLKLQINAAAVVTDISGNPLVTTGALADDTVITVNPANPFLAWSGGATFDADTNGDGVNNGLAWLLGAADKDVNATGLLPKVSQSSGNLVLTFRCLKVAGRGGAVLGVQYSHDLGLTDPWALAGVPDEDSTVNNVVFDTTDDGAFINVVATIPQSEALAGKLFGRLNAVAAP